MKFRGKRCLAGAVVALMALGSAACGGESGAEKTGPPRIAFVLATTELSFAVAMADGFRAGAARVGGVTVDVTGPPIVDGAKQLQMLHEAKQLQMLHEAERTAKDGISVFTLTPDVASPAMADAVEADIPMIAVDNPPMSTTGVKLFVGNDNYQLGRLLAREVVAKLPSGAGVDGKVVIGNNAPGVDVLDKRAKGMRDELKEKLPGVTVLGPFDTKQEIAANLAAWRTLVSANKDAIAFLGTGDADGFNLATIRRERKATWPAGAFDIDPKSLKAVKSGDLVLVSPEHFLKGEVAGWLQAQHAKSGEPLPEGWVYIPGLAVNSANIDAVLARQASAESIAKAVAGQLDTIIGDSGRLRKLSEVS
jgi:ribose transport system substrate-binding protein